MKPRWSTSLDLESNLKGYDKTPRVGFEPTTNRLTADRSTTELPRNAFSILEDRSPRVQLVKSEFFESGSGLFVIGEGGQFQQQVTLFVKAEPALLPETIQEAGDRDAGGADCVGQILVGEPHVEPDACGGRGADF